MEEEEEKGRGVDDGGAIVWHVSARTGERAGMYSWFGSGGGAV